MSDYQYGVYKQIRDEEEHSEMVNRKRKNILKPKKNPNGKISTQELLDNEN